MEGSEGVEIRQNDVQGPVSQHEKADKVHSGLPGLIVITVIILLALTFEVLIRLGGAGDESTGGGGEGGGGAGSESY